MYQLLEIPDLFADACVRDETGNLLFASLYGRDGAILQLMAAFSLKRDEGGLDHFTLVDDAGERHVVTVPEVDRLDKLTGRLPKANLFGNLAHTWLFDKRLVKRDYVNRIAWVIDEAQGQDAAGNQVLDQVWLVMKDLSPVPLLDHWKSTVLELAADSIQILDDSLYPPIGEVTGFRVQLDDSFVNLVSEAVQSRQLRIEPHAEGQGPDAVKPPATPLRLGQVCMTPGVEAVLAERPHLARELLKRHQSGDWGCIGAADRRENLESLKMGWRIMSAYPIDPSQPCEGHGDNTIWIITEADRSVTTLLLPDEY